jgi:hypothetical protein
MGHWEQIGRDNAAERERLASLPAWRRGLHRWVPELLGWAAWPLLIAIGLWALGVL